MPTSNPYPILIGNNVLYPLCLRDGGVLLIDAGPDIAATRDTEESWTSLEVHLAQVGIKTEDIRIVLITHAHLDHAGLAYRWASEGAVIVGGPADLGAIQRGQESRDSQRAHQITDLRRHGCPEKLLQQMQSVRSDVSLNWEPCPSSAIEPAAKSYQLTKGRTLQVIDAPGHTPGNIVAYIPESRELFSGDTILPTTIPTPGMHYPDAIKSTVETERWPSLPSFIKSVNQIRELEVRLILPGHGNVVDDPERLFEKFEKHHSRRSKRIKEKLTQDPISAFAIAKAMFPRIPPRRLGQAITEVLGHLDLLQAVGELEELRGSNGEFQYRTR